MSSRTLRRGIGLFAAAVGFWIAWTATDATNDMRLVGVFLGILGGILIAV